MRDVVAGPATPLTWVELFRGLAFPLALPTAESLGAINYAVLVAAPRLLLNAHQHKNPTALASSSDCRG